MTYASDFERRKKAFERRKKEVRAIANFLLELQGSAEDAMALVGEGDFDDEFVAMLEEDINEIAQELYEDEDR